MRKAGELFNWSFTAIKVPTQRVTMVMSTGCKFSKESAFLSFERGQMFVFEFDSNRVFCHIVII